MSGGSWEYISFKFQDTGQRLLRDNCPYRRALGRLVMDIAEALHNIEWVDSCDTEKGSEMESIKKVVNRQDVLKVLIEDGKIIRDQLNVLLKEKNETSVS